MWVHVLTQASIAIVVEILVFIKEYEIFRFQHGSNFQLWVVIRFMFKCTSWQSLFYTGLAGLATVVEMLLDFTKLKSLDFNMGLIFSCELWYDSYLSARDDKRFILQGFSGCSDCCWNVGRFHKIKLLDVVRFHKIELLDFNGGLIFSPL